MAPRTSTSPAFQRHRRRISFDLSESPQRREQPKKTTRKSLLKKRGHDVITDQTETLASNCMSRAAAADNLQVPSAVAKSSSAPAVSEGQHSDSEILNNNSRRVSHISVPEIRTDDVTGDTTCITGGIYTVLSLLHLIMK